MTIDFPLTYAESRERFCSAVDSLGAERHSLELDVAGIPGLFIDVALIGAPELPAVVVSSGLHGVEAPFGAAVQLALLADRQIQSMPVRFILVHALNPFGYLTGRRVNEDNVDLNRNFLSSFDRVPADDYARFDSLLNPCRPPQRVDLFIPRVLFYLLQEGRQRLQSAIVTGQYAYPKGLFYGGCAKSQTVQILEAYMPQWAGRSPQVCHLDFHTGLGAFARCQLMIQAEPGSARFDWCSRAFGTAELVTTANMGSDDKSAYQASGAMGDWLIQRFNDRPYHFVTAEFGTFSTLRMLSALRSENQAFHFSGPGSPDRVRERKKLETSFCPRSRRWRHAVVSRGVQLIRQAGRALESTVGYRNDQPGVVE